MPSIPEIPDPRGRQIAGILARDAYERWLRNEVLAVLNAAFREIIAEIERTAPTNSAADRNRLASLSARINQLLHEAYNEVGTLTARSLAEYSNVELEAGIAEIAATVRDAGGLMPETSLSLLTRGTVRSIASLPIEGLPLGEWWQTQARAMSTAVRRQIQVGLTLGEGPSEIAARIIPPRDSVAPAAYRQARAQATAVIRTATTAVHNDAAIRSYEEVGDTVSGEYELLTARDNRVSKICAALDGQVFRYDDPQRKVPPFHINALATGTRILTDRGWVPIETVRAGDYAWTHMARWRRVYAVMRKDVPDNSSIRRLETSSGRVLWATDEHPILTRAAGWKRADHIQPGDELFEHGEECGEPRIGEASARLPQVEQSVLIDAHNRPSEFDEPLIAYDVVSAIVPTPVDLERDHVRGESDVEDVALDRMLEYPANGRAVEGVEHELLMPSGVSAVALRHLRRANGRDAALLPWVVRAHARGMARGELLRLFRSLRHPVLGTAGMHVGIAEEEACSVTLGADRDTMSFARRTERRLAQSELALDRADRQAGLPMVSRDVRGNGGGITEVDHNARWRVSAIISNAEVRHNSEVWNLAVEEDETYVAAGVVVHNCRTTIIPRLNYKALGIRPPGKRSPLTFQSFDGWLRDQPARTQADVLGRTRADLYAGGKATLRDLVDSDNRVLTLDELAKRLGTARDAR